MIAALLARAAVGANGLARSLGALSGWRRSALAAALGASAIGALPPLHVLPLLVIAFSGLVWLIDGTRDLRASAIVGWWFGFGHFAAGLYWISHALLVDAAQFGWLVPLAVPGLAAGFALFPAVACVALRLSGARGTAGVLVLAVAWTATEWLRGHILTGFPWNLIGTAWAESAPMMQNAAVIGLYGLSLFTIVVAALPAALAEAQAGWRAVVAAALLITGGSGAGLTRLMLADDGVVPGVHLRLVQPDIPQSLKWDPALRERHFQRTLELTRAPGFSGRTHIIWPETATPFAMAGDAARRLSIASAVPSGGLVITGAPRVEVEPGRPIRVWNSLHAIDGGGAIVGTYDKFHLVPFGEYVPFRRILGVINLIPGSVDFTAGPGPQTLALPGLPKLSPLICYEAIFPTRVLDPADRPGWLLNLTNDAWFGLSSGPYQHFAAARFRAVEEGLPLVRAANNGISAIVDAYGRVVVELGLGRSGVVDGDLPRALPLTPYARFGDAIVLAIGLVLLAPAALRRRRG